MEVIADGESADAVFVLPCDNRYTQLRSLTASSSELVTLLREKGFEVRLFASSVKHKVVVAFITAGGELLRSSATSCRDLRVQMNAHALRSIYDVDAHSASSTSNTQSLEHIFLPYEPALSEQKLYRHTNVLNTCTVRHTIVENVLTEQFLIEQLLQVRVLVNVPVCACVCFITYFPTQTSTNSFSHHYHRRT